MTEFPSRAIREIASKKKPREDDSNLNERLTKCDVKKTYIISFIREYLIMLESLNERVET